MRLEEWKEIFKDPEEEIIQSHECGRNDHDTIGILLTRHVHSPVDVWTLASAWIAGEEEVLDGQADSVGEVKSSSQIAINYCPFCGIGLDSKDQ